MASNLQILVRHVRKDKGAIFGLVTLAIILVIGLVALNTSTNFLSKAAGPASRSWGKLTGRLEGGPINCPGNVYIYNAGRTIYSCIQDGQEKSYCPSGKARLATTNTCVAIPNTECGSGLYCQVGTVGAIRCFNPTYLVVSECCPFGQTIQNGQCVVGGGGDGGGCNCDPGWRCTKNDNWCAGNNQCYGSGLRGPNMEGRPRWDCPKDYCDPNANCSDPQNALGKCWGCEWVH